MAAPRDIRGSRRRPARRAGRSGRCRGSADSTRSRPAAAASRVGSTCTVTSEPTRSRSLWKRCRREISKATNATSHKNRGGGQFLLQTPDVQDPDGVGAAGHRPLQRNAVHQATVEEVLVTDPHRREHPRQRARRQNRLDQVSRAEPVLPCAFDAGRHALERHGEVFEGLRGQSVAQQAAKCVVAVQRRSAAHDFGDAPDQRTVEDAVVGQRVPDRQQTLAPVWRGIRGDGCAVDRADRGAAHQVRAYPPPPATRAPCRPRRRRARRPRPARTHGTSLQ